jgi:type IV pilus assembly protein PilN
VILINLLPHREAALKRRREQFFASLGAAALIGGLIGGGVFSWYGARISNQQERNTFLQTEIKRLEAQIKDIATLQQEITALRARQNAVEDLQGNRNLPVYLLDELVRRLPDGVYMTSLKQDNQTLTITGVAQSNERVSELLRNLAVESPWLVKPELIEITGSMMALTPRDQRRVANYSVRIGLRRASDQPKAPAAPAAAAPGATAVPAASPAPAATVPPAPAKV